jgi:uncharacterized protein (TIGR01777 family)
MKIIIAGASGFIGKYFSDNLIKEGNDVIHISRSSDIYNWKPENLLSTINGADVLINLAGRSINCRHNHKNKSDILSSRLVSTRLLSDAVSACQNPPKLWINASATGIYSHNVTQPHTENSDNYATDFLSHVVQSWEDAFFSPQHPNTRKVALRFSVVLGKNGGALQPLKLLTRLGLGGKQGHGKQKFSWIHLADLYRIIDLVIKNTNINGVINCSAPNPVSNADLMKTLREKMRIKIGLPAPAFAVKIGTFLIGIDSNLVLESSNVVSTRLKEFGFKFKYNNIDEALKDLL